VGEAEVVILELVVVVAHGPSVRPEPVCRLWRRCGWGTSYLA
jgi:hypothetical protein